MIIHVTGKHIQSARWNGLHPIVVALSDALGLHHSRIRIDNTEIMVLGSARVRNVAGFRSRWVSIPLPSEARIVHRDWERYSECHPFVFGIKATRTFADCLKPRIGGKI